MERYFTEFSNATRMHIFRYLDHTPASLSHLTKELGSISPSEVSRHLSRLQKTDLITKDDATHRKYVLTLFGKQVLNLINPLLFLFNHHDYFLSHSILDLPLEFQYKVNALNQAQFIEGTGNVMIEFQKYVDLPGSKIHVMVDSRFPFVNPKLDMDYICHEQMKEMKPNTEGITTRHRFKFLSKIPLLLTYSDMGIGFIGFPLNNTDKPDYTYAFKVTDREGLNFIKNLWEYYWNLEKEYHLIDSDHSSPEIRNS